jgi:nitric oxide reductase subunit C
MDKRTARNIFIAGTIFFFTLFLLLTVDTMKRLEHRAPPITKAVHQGKMLWQKYDCIGCHTILGNGSYFAPDLTKIVQRKPPLYLERWLTNPKRVRSDATMPVLGITEEEAKHLVAFLSWISQVDTNGWPPEPLLARATAAAGKAASAGQTLYQKYACSACHALSGIGGTTGPQLTSIGRQRDKSWLEAWLKDPQAIKPGTAMPSFGHLSDDEVSKLADYLASLQ